MKKNHHQIRYGTKDGEIQFGHLHDDNNLSSSMLRNGHNDNHYISLDASGPQHRKDSTMCMSPGSFQVIAGNNPLIDGYALEEGSDGIGLSIPGLGDKDKPGVPAIFLDAENGDVVIRAPNGRIRIEAIDVHVKASGSNNGRGVLTLEGNEKIIAISQHIELDAKVSARIFSEKTVDIIGNGILDIYGGLVDIADGATKIKGSKGISTNEIKNGGGGLLGAVGSAVGGAIGGAGGAAVGGAVGSAVGGAVGL